MDSTTLIGIMGVAIAAAFWIVTQWNIVRTKRILLAFQKEARDRADLLISDQFKKMEILIDQKISRIPSPDLTSFKADLMSSLPEMDSEQLLSDIGLMVNQQLNALIPSMGAQVREDLKLEMRAFQDRENTRIKKELTKYGIAINETGEAIEGEIMAQAQEGLSPVQIQALNFLKTNPSQTFIEENPGAAMFLQLAKMSAMQFLQGNGNSIPGIFSGQGKNTQERNKGARSGIFG